MQATAGELESAIRKGRHRDDIESLATALEMESDLLMAAILAALPVDDAMPYDSEIDWTMVQHILAELEPLLKEGNMRANDLLETHLALLRAALGTLGIELEQRVEHFHYAEAQEIIECAREKHTQLVTS